MRYDLAEVKRTIQEHPDRVRVTRSTGTDMIIAVRRCGAADAVRFAKFAVLMLSERDYSETVRLASGADADVYAKVLEENPWYIKLLLDEERELVILSCHLTDRDLRTRGGVVRCTVRPNRR